MVEKVKVGHEEYKALNNIMEKLVPLHSLFEIFTFRQDGGKFQGERAAANNLTLEELFYALTVGYEEKPSPADMIVADIIHSAEKEYFCVDMCSSNEEDKAMNKGILRAIALLKDEGVKFKLKDLSN